MKKQLRKKISTSIVSLMLLSMLMPVLSYAAAFIQFDYNEKSGYLSGGVYTADPDSVKVERVDGSGTVEIIAGEVSPWAGFQYDDNNVPYIYKHFSAYVGSNSTKEMIITEGKDQKVVIIPKNDTNGYYYHNDTVTLDVYRMKGTEHFSGKLEKSFLKSGDKLVTFTPEKSGFNDIEVELPMAYGEGESSLFNAKVAVGLDFELTNTTVNQSVYASKVQPSSSYSYEKKEVVYSDYSLVLNFDEPLIKGNTYELKLSNTSGGDEIQLPQVGNNYYTNVKYGDYTSYKHHLTGEDIYFLASENITRFRNVSITTETTNQTPGGGAPIEPEKDKQVVSEDSLNNAKDGIVSIEISKEKPQVLLPINASEAVGNNKLHLESDGLTVEIPTKVLAKLQGILPADQLEGAQISFGFKNVLDSAATDLLNKAKTQSNAGVKAAGDIYDFSLSVVTKDGKVTELSQFEEPITISLKVSATSNKSLIGVYYIADDGTIEYVGGTLVGDEIKADIHHFSKYAVLEFDKSFTDVAAGYWAADIIKEMAAKHIVQGVSTDRFAPQAAVTRAEFAALIARALGLKATGPSAFADVNASAWYADAVAAASQAGIVQGKDAATFAPNAKITREEMSALLVRAYEYKAGSKLAAGTESKFADRSEAAEWALAYIDAAYTAGFIQGRNDNEFAPKAQLTRAESTKAIYTLLVK